MSDICNKLKDWGCDIDGAMRRFLNDETLYESCLNTMIKDENFNLLQEYLAANDVTQAFNAAHTLKGSLGNMGLTPLYNKILEIVEILRLGSTEGVQFMVSELLALKETLDSIYYSTIQN